MMQRTGKSFFDILSLSLRSRCPVCSQGRLFVPLTQVSSLAELCIPPTRCQNCSFQFRREPGYYFGVLTPVLPILSLAMGLLFVIIYYLWAKPEDPMDLIAPGTIGVLLGFFLFFRTAVAIFISFDHAIDPPQH